MCQTLHMKTKTTLISSPKRYMCIHKISRLCPEYSWMIILWPNGFLSKTGDLSDSTVFQSRICFRELWGNARRTSGFLPILGEPKFSCFLDWEAAKGSCQVPRGSGMARIEPKSELCCTPFHGRKPVSLVKLSQQREVTKEERPKLC